MDYANRVHLSPGTYKGDVETAYCIACTEQTDFHVKELEKEIKLLEIELLDTDNSEIETRERIRRHIEGINIAIEVIRQWPNAVLTYHAKRYTSAPCPCSDCTCGKK